MRSWLLTPALLLPLLQGCIVSTIPTFIHDKMLGPASPAGNTRAYASQTGFEVTDQGVTAFDSGLLWRPSGLLLASGRKGKTLRVVAVFWLATLGPA